MTEKKRELLDLAIRANEPKFEEFTEDDSEQESLQRRAMAR